VRALPTILSKSSKKDILMSKMTPRSFIKKNTTPPNMYKNPTGLRDLEKVEYSLEYSGIFNLEIHRQKKLHIIYVEKRTKG
jgi:hypothetical protein